MDHYVIFLFWFLKCPVLILLCFIYIFTFQMLNRSSFYKCLVYTKLGSKLHLYMGIKVITSCVSMSCGWLLKHVLYQLCVWLVQMFVHWSECVHVCGVLPLIHEEASSSSVSSSSQDVRVTSKQKQWPLTSWPQFSSFTSEQSENPLATSTSSKTKTMVMQLDPEC